MRTLAFVFFTAPALAVLLLGCDSNAPLEPAAVTDLRLTAAASGAQLLAPTSATAVSSSESQIDITWQDGSSNETKFEVHRSTTGESGVFTLLATTGPNLVAYRDRGLEPGTPYCYRIRAARVVSASKTIYSTFSNTACVTPVLAAPSNASAVTASESQIDISWQDNSNYESGFEIYRSAYGETGPFVVLAITGPNTVAHSDGSLLSARRYCYQVRARRVTDNGFSYSAFANTACATTLPPSSPPAAVSDVNAKPNDSHTIRVSWTDNATNEEGFRIYRSTDGGASWNLASTAGVNQWSLEDSGRQSEQRVWYRVMAFNPAGETAPSNIASTTPPAGPTNLTEQLVDAQTAELSWNDNSAVEGGYQVWLRWGTYSCCGGGACDAGIYEYETPVAELPANSTTYRYGTGGGGSCGFALYGYHVIATKDGGSSDPSDEVPAW
jgi:fibronectin type 3 domain-containing protein